MPRLDALEASEAAADHAPPSCDAAELKFDHLNGLDHTPPPLDARPPSAPIA